MHRKYMSLLFAFIPKEPLRQRSFSPFAWPPEKAQNAQRRRPRARNPPDSRRPVVNTQRLKTVGSVGLPMTKLMEVSKYSSMTKAFQNRNGSKTMHTTCAMPFLLVHSLLALCLFPPPAKPRPKDSEAPPWAEKNQKPQLVARLIKI